MADFSWRQKVVIVTVGVASIYSIYRFLYLPSTIKKQKSSNEQIRAVLLMQGCPGLGKSTLAPYVLERFRKGGLDAVCIEQDMFKGKKSGRKCKAAFKELLKQNHNIVMLNRNNPDFADYKDYISMSRESDFKILAFYPEEYRSRKLIPVVWQSVLNRQDHPTFDKLKDTKKLTIAYSMLRRIRPCSESDLTTPLKWLNCTKMLSESKAFLTDYLKDRKYSDFDLSEISEGLHFSTVNYSKRARRSLDSISNDVVATTLDFLG